MKHLEWHQHAFIDKDNVVINIGIYQESAHNSELIIDSIKVIENAEQVICCCTFGIANVGDTWTGTEFRTAQLHKGWIWDSETKLWNPPIPKPDDGPIYEWSDEKEQWVEIE